MSSIPLRYALRTAMVDVEEEDAVVAVEEDAGAKNVYTLQAVDDRALSSVLQIKWMFNMNN